MRERHISWTMALWVGMFATPVLAQKPTPLRVTRSGVTVISTKGKNTPRVKKVGTRTPVYYSKKRGKNKVPKDVVEFTANFKKQYKCQRLPLNLKINFDLREAPLDEVTKFISCITAKNFIIAEDLSKGKKLTILAPRQITVYEAYKAYLVALSANGMTIVAEGQFLKIIKKASAITEVTPIIPPGKFVPNDSSVVTRFISPKHIPASEIKTLLEQFKGKEGKILEYPPTNSLIVTDTAVNIRRLLKLIRIIDVPSGKERIWMRPLEHVGASPMKEILEKIFDTGKKKPKTTTTTNRRYIRYRYRRQVSTTSQTSKYTAPQAVQVSKIVAEDRTNQLIIISNRQSYLKIDRLIRKLDVPLPEDSSIHIYHLENASAKDVATALSSLAGKKKTTTTTRGKKPAPKPTNQAASATLLGDVKITAYEPSNSLIIEANRKQYVAVKNLVQKLDVRVKQVYVEAIIMEITTDKDRKFGIGANGGHVFNIGGEQVPLMAAFGGLGLSNINLQQIAGGGLGLGLQGPQAEVKTGTNTSTAVTLAIPVYGFLLQMIQTNSDVNVLSTPHILTMDNEVAEIQVGRRIPYQSQSLSGLGTLGLLSGSTGTTNPLSSLGSIGSVKTVDVDLTLKIKPQINESDFVRLEIDQKIDEVDRESDSLGPTVSKRRIKNKVIVKDQQPVVIGGLMKDLETKGVSKVPFLGDIPILGILFRQTTKRIEKKNLLLVITPYIIRDPQDLKRIHQKKMEQIRLFSDKIAVRRKEYEGFIDFGKKHGLLEEIHQLVIQARKERLMLEKAKLEGQDIDTIGDPDTHDISYDPFKIRRKKGKKMKQGTTKKDERTIKVKPEIIDLD